MKKAPIMLAAAVLAVLLTVVSIGLLSGGTPWALAQTEESEPAVIPLGPQVRHIDPEPWGLMYRHAAGEDVRANVVVVVHTDATITVTKSLEDQITDAGGSHVSGNTWRVPTSALASVVQRADVVIVERVPGLTGQASIPAYNRMWGSLEGTVASLGAGVPASEAALKSFIAKDGKVAVFVDAASASQEASVRTWMTTRGITPVDEVSGADTSDNVVVGMVPVSKVVELSNAFTTARLYAESYDGQDLTSDRSTWSSEFRNFESDLITFYTNGTLPTGATGSGNSGGTGQGGATVQNGDLSKAWDDGLVQRLTEHGVKAWQDDGHTALGIKVGIIDWGFSGLNDTPGLMDLDIWDEDDNPSGNAFCQPVRHGTWPLGISMKFLSLKCQPIWIVDSVEVDHGVNIAELVKDIAPNAKLFYAQANSPRQVYKAARWLDETKNVDVIVHAAGWAYDGKGDGTSPLGASPNWTFNESDPGWNTDEHSPYRYEPSPLKTVDEFTEYGPVWVNAAGNMELLTMRKTGLSVVGGSTIYKDFLTLNSGVSAISTNTAGQRACQRIPWNAFKIYIHNLRWADSWSSSGASADLDFFVSNETVHPQQYGYRAYANTADGYDEQLPRVHPVRRTVKIGGENDDLACLRIRVNRDDEGNLPTLPKWIQFQILTQDYETAVSWNTGNDVTGHSIVNPASSASPNLLAMGARDMRSPSIQLMSYSSQGPVYRKNASLTSEAPGRVKPDVTAASGAATWTKFNNECDEDNTAAECGDDLYFGGTSAATAHGGGMAALVVQLFKEIGIPYNAADVASYLKDAGVQIKTGEANQNYEWGHGFIKLPCRPIPVTKIPYTSSSARWNTEDCKSTRRSGAYVDYYTFHSTVDRKIKIDVESSVDSYLYLIDGAYNGGGGYLERDNNGGDDANDARITRKIAPGTYTIAVTTRSPNRMGSYILKIKSSPTWDATLTPIPGTMVADGSWNRFRVTSGDDVKVVANPTSPARLEISTSSRSGNLCGGEVGDTRNRSDGESIYLAGCAAGAGTIELRRAADNSLVRTYNVPVVTPVAQVCQTPTSFGAMRASASQVNLAWIAPAGADSKTPTGYRILVMKLVGGKWQYERYINEPSSRTSALHLGLDGGFYYAYQVSTKCASGEYSAATSWKMVSPWSGGSGYDGVSGARGPDPTPTPSGVVGTGSQEPIDEMPPTPK